MTINMLFFTISIRQIKLSRQESFHQEKIQKWHDRNRDRMLDIHNVM
ncbi:YrzI family small protein [Peribacillus deserti]|uniref:YrzI family protein n=1 Tax=Peribacillus deserti TaxID=673318 RepID=A0A2N5M985_9BACI|nr:YrzI family small protein [Peribacillus deserti]PLT30914.1 YrzI family protein [Peribacillus deserti]